MLRNYQVSLSILFDFDYQQRAHILNRSIFNYFTLTHGHWKFFQCVLYKVENESWKYFNTFNVQDRIKLALRFERSWAIMNSISFIKNQGIISLFFIVLCMNFVWYRTLYSRVHELRMTVIERQREDDGKDYKRQNQVTHGEWEDKTKTWTTVEGIFIRVEWDHHHHHSYLNCFFMSLRYSTYILFYEKNIVQIHCTSFMHWTYLYLLSESQQYTLHKLEK